MRIAGLYCGHTPKNINRSKRKIDIKSLRPRISADDLDDEFEKSHLNCVEYLKKIVNFAEKTFAIDRLWTFFGRNFTDLYGGPQLQARTT